MATITPAEIEAARSKGASIQTGAPDQYGRATYAYVDGELYDIQHAPWNPRYGGTTSPGVTTIEGREVSTASKEAQERSASQVRGRIESPPSGYKTVKTYFLGTAGGDYREKPQEMKVQSYWLGTSKTGYREAPRRITPDIGFLARVAPKHISPKPEQKQAPPIGKMPGAPSWSEQALRSPGYAMFKESIGDRMRAYEASKRLTLYSPAMRAIGYSERLQSRFERMIGYSEGAPAPVKFAAGFGSTFTSIPGFVASGAAGYEALIKYPSLTLRKAPKSVLKIGTRFVGQAISKPIETTGFIAGSIFGGKAFKAMSKVSVPKTRGYKMDIIPTETKNFPVLESLKGLKTKREALTELKIKDFEKQIEVFKPRTIGKTTERPSYGVVPESLKGLKTKKDFLAELKPKEMEVLGKSIEKPSYGFVPEQLKGLRTKREALTELRSKGFEREIGGFKPQTFGRSIEKPSYGVVPESLRGLVTAEERLAQLNKQLGIKTKPGFKEFLKSESAISYIPTYEKLKTPSRIRKRLEVMTITSHRPIEFKPFKMVSRPTKTRTVPLLTLSRPISKQTQKVSVSQTRVFDRIITSRKKIKVVPKDNTLKYKKLFTTPISKIKMVDKISTFRPTKQIPKTRFKPQIKPLTFQTTGLKYKPKIERPPKIRTTKTFDKYIKQIKKVGASKRYVRISPTKTVAELRKQISPYGGIWRKKTGRKPKKVRK